MFYSESPKKISKRDIFGELPMTSVLGTKKSPSSGFPNNAGCLCTQRRDRKVICLLSGILDSLRFRPVKRLWFSFISNISKQNNWNVLFFFFSLNFSFFFQYFFPLNYFLLMYKEWLRTLFGPLAFLGFSENGKFSPYVCIDSFCVGPRTRCSITVLLEIFHLLPSLLWLSSVVALHAGKSFS